MVFRTFSTEFLCELALIDTQLSKIRIIVGKFYSTKTKDSFISGKSIHGYFSTYNVGGKVYMDTFPGNRNI